MKKLGRAKGVNGQKAKGKTEKKIRVLAMVVLSFSPFPLLVICRFPVSLFRPLSS
jgi:hypothetical protein